MAFSVIKLSVVFLVRASMWWWAEQSSESLVKGNGRLHFCFFCFSLPLFNQLLLPLSQRERERERERGSMGSKKKKMMMVTSLSRRETIPAPEINARSGGGDIRIGCMSGIFHFLSRHHHNSRKRLPSGDHHLHPSLSHSHVVIFRVNFKTLLWT